MSYDYDIAEKVSQETLCGVMKHNVGSPGTTTSYDLIILHNPNIARNANQVSFEAYSDFAGILPTGLIEGIFGTYFPISVLRASNKEKPILMREKPALLFPIGWRIGSEMTWSP